MGLTVGLGLVLCILLRLFQSQFLGLYIKPTDESYAAVMAAGVTRVLAVSQFQWVGGMMETACGSPAGAGPLPQPYRHHPHRRLRPAGGMAVHGVRRRGHHRKPVLVVPRLLAADTGGALPVFADLSAQAAVRPGKVRFLCFVSLIWIPPSCGRLSALMDWFVVSFFTLLCALPVFTAGPALCALYGAMGADQGRGLLPQTVFCRFPPLFPPGLPVHAAFSCRRLLFLSVYPGSRSAAGTRCGCSSGQRRCFSWLVFY